MLSKVVLFGASSLGEAAYGLLKSKYSIAYFCDNSPEKWGKQFCGVSIISPQMLKDLEDFDIIITSSHFKAIAEQLINMGFDYFRIFKYVISNNFCENFTSRKINTEFHGNDYGGYMVCPDLITENSIVYSFGIGRDISFDMSLINKYNLNVYAFDPTPRCIRWVKARELPTNFRFQEWGISDFDGSERFYAPDNKDFDSYTIIKDQYDNCEYISAPVYTLKTIANGLGHNKIDVLKMDIEGSEYKVIKDILNSDVQCDQLLIEFHHRFGEKSFAETKEIIQQLKKYGYELFYVSSTDTEFSFIKRNIL